MEKIEEKLFLYFQEIKNIDIDLKCKVIEVDLKNRFASLNFSTTSMLALIKRIRNLFCSIALE